ncbi:cupin-like domain-containing protein [Sphingomonas sp. DG1-23]|uniref:cupin-like domain-containing protein n=1 Tax=Sphingomonas sp. DG1-23 TaxID=3068316 RepID=UPI00273FA73F|nr:cupin-like domain-containing protein [Sphingomonas sp. DG1-23]MDP5279685.1 cupin-like domain-containing protein [Sphingomonas sp. DG1-23]
MARRTKTVAGVAPDAIPYAALLAAQEPVILTGVARDWPLVRRGREGPEAAMAYLAGFDGGKPITGFTGPPEIGGRFGYDEAGTGLNFASERLALGDFLDRVCAHLGEERAPSCYAGSTDLDLYLPGLRAENGLILNDPMFAAHPPLVSIWLGNRTTAAAHYDMSNNLACCMVGRRRFTLFPPDQVANLYPGPLEPTPGGQVVTMVDFRDPDFERYPRFRAALDAAQVAELEPGDLLFYPALWWHQVDALDGFNAMINYWWNMSPAFMDTPQNVLLHALLSLRDRPEPEKKGWRALFDYYVFGEPERAGAHLPEAARGALGPLDEMKARRLRAQLLNRLNR